MARKWQKPLLQIPMAFIATGLCLFALALLLLAEFQSNSLLRGGSKAVASAAFVVLGLSLATTADAYSRYIVAGLVLGAIGDLALLSSSSRGFLVGLISFLLGHIAYVVACATLVAIPSWGGIVAVPPCLAAVFVLAYLWKHLGKIRIAVLLYVATIVLMVVGAIAVWQSDVGAIGEQQATLLLVGALLFFVSDIAVAKSRFVAARFLDKCWGLPAYYGGQLCIAWSLAN